MNQPARSTDEQQTQKDEANAQWWIVVSSPSQNPYTYESTNHQKKGKWPKKALSNIWLKVREASMADWLMVIFTGVIAFYAYSQYTEMHHSSNDTHDLAVAAKSQADAAKATADSSKQMADQALAQAAATNDLAKEAKRQADITAESIKANLESAHLDQRPWLKVSTGFTDVVIEDGKPVVAKIQISDLGKTPAKAAHLDAAVELVTSPSNMPKLTIEGRHWVADLPTVFPNETINGFIQNNRVQQARI